MLGPDVDLTSETGALFLADIVRDMTQKTGQKCTAVRRILVPSERIDAVQEALISRLSKVVVGNPADLSTRMGPVATAQQLDQAEALLRAQTRDHGPVIGRMPKPV